MWYDRPMQAKAMADIAEHFNWTYVNTVASEGEYGEMGIDSFRAECRHRNICIAVSEKVSLNADASRFDEIIQRLYVKPSARVVVLFLRVEDARDLLAAARRQNKTGHFVWVASDGWGKEEMPVRVPGNDVAAEGALTIELQTNPLPEFDTYFRRLTPETNRRNPWFHEYWSRAHDCVFDDPVVKATDSTSAMSDGGSGKGRFRNASLTSSSLTQSFPSPDRLPASGLSNVFAAGNSATVTSSASGKRRCTGREAITPKIYTQESKIQFVFDAVYAFAHALHRMVEDTCGYLQTGADADVGGNSHRTRSGPSSAAARDQPPISAKSKFKECVRSLQGADLYKIMLNISFDGKCCHSHRLRVFRIITLEKLDRKQFCPVVMDQMGKL
jgi:hypothetical protein